MIFIECLSRTVEQILIIFKLKVQSVLSLLKKNSKKIKKKNEYCIQKSLYIPETSTKT